MPVKNKKIISKAYYQEEIMCWLETHENHIMNGENPHYVIFKGHHHEIYIPKLLYITCEKYIKSGNKFDNRSWRWDFEKMFKDFQEKHAKIDAALTAKGP